jgi:hypothetical protein
MTPLNTTPPEIRAIDRSVPMHVKILGLICLFMLGVGTGAIFTVMACQAGWIAK